MRFIDKKTDGGTIKGKTAFYCGALNVTRQGFYWYLKHRDIPWKYKDLAEKMRTIAAEDECNDTYGRCRMCQALTLKYPDDDIPSERTVYRVMEEIGLSHRPNRKPNGITKADRNARKSDDLLKRDFTAQRPLEKCVTDITEIPAQDGKLYVSAIFDCYDLGVLGLSLADNMRVELCISTIENAFKAFPSISGAIIHSDRGSQYTSASYRAELNRCGIVQSMNRVYVRNGVAGVFMISEPLSGRRETVVTQTRTALDFAEILRYTSDTLYRRAEKIVLVTDNLNTHSPASIYKAFPPEEARRLTECFEWHYTPKHGSWLDMAEIEIGISRQALGKPCADLESFGQQVRAWTIKRNAECVKINWQFKTQDARIKLARLYRI